MRNHRLPKTLTPTTACARSTQKARRTITAYLRRSSLIAAALFLWLIPLTPAWATRIPQPSLFFGATPSPTSTSPATATLVVHATINTTGTHPGNTLKGQIWIAATGSVARNAILTTTTTSRSTTITLTCTLASNTHCKLGDLDISGISIPITLTTSANDQRFTLTATVTASNAATTTAATPISLSPAPTPSPSRFQSPSPSTSASPSTPSASPQTTATPTTSPTASPTTSLVLPDITPTPDTTIPTHPDQRRPNTSTPTPKRIRVATTLATGQGLWLLLLTGAVVLAAAAPTRRKKNKQTITTSTTIQGVQHRSPSHDSSGALGPPRLDLAVLFRIRTFHRKHGQRPNPHLQASVIEIDTEQDSE
jgi:hypothetical protein